MPVKTARPFCAQVHVIVCVCVYIWQSGCFALKASLNSSWNSLLMGTVQHQITLYLQLEWLISWLTLSPIKICYFSLHNIGYGIRRVVFRKLWWTIYAVNLQNPFSFAKMISTGEIKFVQLKSYLEQNYRPFNICLLCIALPLRRLIFCVFRSSLCFRICLCNSIS